ncbi:ASCH domain-containing protein [Actinophytocola sp. KF-1]
MLIERRLHQGIRDGSVTVMFRRWKRRQVTAGHTYRTAAGRVVVDEVTEVAPSRIRSADARAAGYPSVAAAVADLRGTPGDPVFLVRLHMAGDEDPRAALASAAELSTEDIAEITRRLERLDRASTHGPWTDETLDIIRRRPAVRAGDLAAELGREMLPFKVDVRKLKNLGLTLSLEVGYRLSPRGAAYLAGR